MNAGNREPSMTSYSSVIGSSVVRLVCVFIALSVGAGAQAQSLQIAASNAANETPNSYLGPLGKLVNTPQNNNVIYGVTATPQTGLPPALSLNVLPINPVFPSTGPYSGFYSLVYAPSTQPGLPGDPFPVQAYFPRSIW